MDSGPALEADGPDLLALPGRPNVVGRAVGGGGTRPVELGDRGSQEVAGIGLGPVPDGDRVIVGGRKDHRQRHGKEGHRHQRDQELLE
jgi:hypothetical protein